MTRALLLFALLMVLTNTLTKAQLVSEKFTDTIFSDNFESDKGIWKIMSNGDNLFLIQDGKYLLQRKNPKSSYSVFPKWNNPASAFEITANFVLESTEGPESGVGIIFMAQADGTGAFVLEINSKKQFRLKQLVGVNFKLLTGQIKTNGWVDSGFLNGVNETNLLQVKASARNYDVYINQNYVLSFTELAYKTGNIGISAGPSSKFLVDQISVYIMESDSSAQKLQTINNVVLPADSQAVLLEELRVLREENKVLKDLIKIYQSEKKNTKGTKSEIKFPEPEKHPE
ncbi:MAG: hypothetical protein EYC69_02320 [Bacteroidetes bacterium]|nr:MAG: hypothetical protein EYC69_02320 [Bacteroidota bacterium]